MIIQYMYSVYAGSFFVQKPHVEDPCCFGSSIFEFEAEVSLLMLAQSVTAFSTSMSGEMASLRSKCLPETFLCIGSR